MMKNTQNITPKQKSGIYSNKIHKATIVALLLVLLCYCFSTLTLATETSININRISSFDMYGYDENLSSQNWRSISYVITSSNSLKTQWIGYGQTRQRIYLTFLNSVNIKQYKVEFDIIAKNISPTNESAPAVRVPQSSSTWTYGTANLTNQITDGNDTYYTYHIKIERSNMNTTQSTMSIYTYFSIVSTEYRIEKFSCVLNDEIYLAISTYADEHERLKQAEQALYNAIDNNGVNGLPSRLQQIQQHYRQVQASIHNSGFEINKQYFDSILNASTAITAMLTMTMVITVCSYALFGKLR